LNVVLARTDRINADRSCSKVASRTHTDSITSDEWRTSWRATQVLAGECLCSQGRNSGRRWLRRLKFCYRSHVLN